MAFPLTRAFSVSRRCRSKEISAPLTPPIRRTITPRSSLWDGRYSESPDWPAHTQARAFCSSKAPGSIEKCRPIERMIHDRPFSSSEARRAPPGPWALIPANPTRRATASSRSPLCMEHDTGFRRLGWRAAVKLSSGTGRNSLAHLGCHFIQQVWQPGSRTSRFAGQRMCEMSNLE